MDLKKLECTLQGIFGENNVKPYTRGFRVIVDYENMPYCIVLRADEGRLVLDRDAVDQEEHNYEEAYRNAYKILIQNKDKFDDGIDF